MPVESPYITTGTTQSDASAHSIRTNVEAHCLGGGDCHWQCLETPSLSWLPKFNMSLIRLTWSRSNGLGVPVMFDSDSEAEGSKYSSLTRSFKTSSAKKRRLRSPSQGTTAQSEPE